jgi:hypothetical protein
MEPFSPKLLSYAKRIAASDAASILYGLRIDGDDMAAAGGGGAAATGLSPFSCGTREGGPARADQRGPELSTALKVLEPLLLRMGPCYFERARGELSNGTLGVR